MKLIFYPLFLLSTLFFAACGDSASFIEENPEEKIQDQPDTEITAAQLSITAIEILPFNTVTTYLASNTYRFKLKITLSDDSVAYQTTNFESLKGSLAGDILWSSSNPEVASIDSNGLLTAKIPGDTLIRAVLLGVQTNLAINIKLDNQLAKLDFSSEEITLSKPNAVKVGIDYTLLDGTIYNNRAPDELKLPCQTILSSSNESVLKITQAGMLIPLSNGSVSIVAKCGPLSDVSHVTITAFQIEQDIPLVPPTDTPPSGNNNQNNNEVENVEEHLQSIEIITNQDTVLIGNGLYTYKCRLTFNSGIINNVTSHFISPEGQASVISWESSNSNLASFNQNSKFVPKKYGDVQIEATALGLSATKNISILLAPEAPPNTNDRYLGAADTLTINYGAGASFGQNNYPQVLYGPPQGLFSTSVLSLGFGGELTIELADYIIVDGPGADFTVFENPIVSGNFVFAERALIAASEDGNHFEEFPCDIFDPAHVFTGCAGVHPFNEGTSPYNPLVSGGDSFDLSDIDLPVAKYIRITDAQTCIAGDITHPLCGEGGKKGFDMDALSIINGRREPLDINY